MSLEMETYTFSGSHHDIGFQQGQALRESIQKGLKDLLNSEPVKMIKPRFLPTSIFLSMAKRRAEKMLKNDVSKYYPKQAQRMEGIAEGAGLDLPTVLFMQMMEMMLGGCTSLGFSSRITSTSETIIAKNMDFLNFLRPFNLTCETKPREGYRTLGIKFSPLPGTVDGMNEHGLVVTHNYARSTDVPTYHVPMSIVLQEMLESCRNTDEAVEFVTRSKRGGHDCILILADSEDRIKTVEISKNHAAVRDATRGMVVNTNNYQTSEMQQREIPTDKSSNLPGYLSSKDRLERAMEILKEKSVIDEKTVSAILGDHGKDNRPTELTICRHGGTTGTLWSAIFYPKRRSLKVSYKNPCQNKFEEIRFS